MDIKISLNNCLFTLSRILSGIWAFNENLTTMSQFDNFIINEYKKFSSDWNIISCNYMKPVSTNLNQVDPTCGKLANCMVNQIEIILGELVNIEPDSGYWGTIELLRKTFTGALNKLI